MVQYLRLGYRTWPANSAVAQHLRHNWSKIGVAGELYPHDGSMAVLNEMMRRGQLDVIYSGWAPD